MIVTYDGTRISANLLSFVPIGVIGGRPITVWRVAEPTATINRRYSMTRRAWGVLALVVALAVPASAGRFNKKLSIGDAAPKFSGLPGVDGKTYSLGDFKAKEVLVLVVTCNHCPVATAYQDRLIAFAKKYAAGPDSKAALVAVNVNQLEAEKLPKMKERANEKGYNFPYLRDESQAIARALGASVTPEFFVLNKERKIVYMGAMDDDLDDPKTDYVSAAVEAALKGAKVSTAETRPRGCSVKYAGE
jgi:peroxiredoxin